MLKGILSAPIVEIPPAPVLTFPTDVNECSIGNGGCQQMCVNEPGTFMCSCFGGYLLNDDGVNCTRLIEVYHNISGSYISCCREYK